MGSKEFYARVKEGDTTSYALMILLCTGIVFGSILVSAITEPSIYRAFVSGNIFYILNLTTSVYVLGISMLILVFPPPHFRKFSNRIRGSKLIFPVVFMLIILFALLSSFSIFGIALKIAFIVCCIAFSLLSCMKRPVAENEG